MAIIERFGHGGDILTASKQFGVETFIDFSANINPLGPPVAVREAINNGLSSIMQYPDPAHRTLKAKISKQLTIPDEMILIGNGAAECMALCIQGLQPKRVGVIYPCFSEYEQLALKFGAEVKACYGLEENNFQASLEDIFSLLEETDLLFLGHPNNPTGNLYAYHELIQIAEFAKKFNTYLVVDEAFIDFIEGYEQLTLINEITNYSNVIIIRSMTKFYAIPGLRLGYMVAAPSIINTCKNKQVTWSVNQLALLAGEACFEDVSFSEQTVKLIQSERNYLENHIKCKVYPSLVNYLLLKLPDELPAEALQANLGKKGILIRSCAMYPGLTDYHVRVAVKSRVDNEKLLYALNEVLERG